MDLKPWNNEIKQLREIILKPDRIEENKRLAYGIWHSTRIKDITMNLLVAGDKQIFNRESWQEFY